MFTKLNDTLFVKEKKNSNGKQAFSFKVRNFMLMREWEKNHKYKKERESFI